MVATYDFASTWLIECSRTQLWATLEEFLATDDPMPWWSAVRVQAHHGESIDLVTDSGFGYKLAFTVYDLCLARPDSMRFRATGDLVGTAHLDFYDRGLDRSQLDIGWHVEVTRRWMRISEPVLRPFFIVAHSLMMRRGERRLNIWLSGRG